MVVAISLVAVLLAYMFQPSRYRLAIEGFTRIAFECLSLLFDLIPNGPT